MGAPKTRGRPGSGEEKDLLETLKEKGKRRDIPARRTVSEVGKKENGEKKGWTGEEDCWQVSFNEKGDRKTPR